MEKKIKIIIEGGLRQYELKDIGMIVWSMGTWKKVEVGKEW